MKGVLFACLGLGLLVVFLCVALSADDVGAGARGKALIVIVSNAPGEASANTFTATNTPEPCGCLWSVVASPNGDSNDNFLTRVAVVSVNDVWAVGGYYPQPGFASHTLVEHWDGGAWSVVPSANVGTVHNFFYDIAAVSANDVWAVGYYEDNSYQTLVEHWDGTAWSIVASPSLNTTDNRLHGVASVSANDVWAVGYYGSASTYQTLVEHWDGGSWSVVSSPNRDTGYDSLEGVAAVSANDVWAVGTLIEHWDGSTWSIVNGLVPSGALNRIVALSANDMWAVGDVKMTGVKTLFAETLIEHWDGSAWSVVSSPNVGSRLNEFYGLAAVSSSDVWAVGNYDSDGIIETPVEHWDGATWLVVTSPNPSTSQDVHLYGVAAVSANDVWAVGHYSDPGLGPYRTLVEHYAPLCTPYGTPTDTPTTTPTTPTPIIVGHVTWQGPPAQPNARQQQSITLTLKLGATEVNYPSQSTDASGFFTVSLGSLPGGTYEWRAKGAKYLAGSGVVNLVGAPSTQVEMGLMRAGDATNDNLVSVADVNILKRTFGLCIGDVGYDSRGDFDNSNCVSVVDFNLLRGNFGFGGAPPIIMPVVNLTAYTFFARIERLHPIVHLKP